ALLLFVIPSKTKKGEKLLDWDTAVKIPWDVIVLFGGGFAIAKGFGHTGLTDWIASQFSLLQGMNLVLILGLIVSAVIFVTEVTSNTATASLLLPLMGALAITLNMDPYLLMAATALACSYAFMLPAATPPNAIVYSSRRVIIMQMVRAGIVINIVAALVLTVAFGFVIPMFTGQ
ncbi:MAG: anion permease, partial [Pseudomonadales bacterium]|nr:anion permease [Pseudomonadales bacterium]